MKNLDDVMRELSYLENVSDGRDEYGRRLTAIAEVLEVFGIKWSFVEEGEKFIAKLK